MNESFLPRVQAPPSPRPADSPAGPGGAAPLPAGRGFEQVLASFAEPPTAAAAVGAAGPEPAPAGESQAEEATPGGSEAGSILPPAGKDLPPGGDHEPRAGADSPGLAPAASRPDLAAATVIAVPPAASAAETGTGPEPGPVSTQAAAAPASPDVPRGSPPVLAAAPTPPAGAEAPGAGNAAEGHAGPPASSASIMGEQARPAAGGEVPLPESVAAAGAQGARPDQQPAAPGAAVAGAKVAPSTAESARALDAAALPAGPAGSAEPAPRAQARAADAPKASSPEQGLAGLQPMAEVGGPDDRLAAGAKRLISPSLQVGPGPLSFTPANPGSSPEPVLRLLGGGERAPAAGAAQAGASPVGSPLSAPAGVLAAASPASGSAAPLASPAWTPEAPAAAAGPAWARPLSEHVLSMVQQGPQVMRLRLDPPELGGLEISLSLSQEQTNVTFTAQNQFARDLIEAGLPRLRELLAQGGLTPGEFNVAADAGGGEGDGSRARWTAGQDGSARLTAEEEAPGLEPASAWTGPLRHGLVDDYA